MTDKERKEFTKSLEKYKKKFAEDGNAAREFLINVGIITKKGNLTKPYKNLCIQQEQA